MKRLATHRLDPSARLAIVLTVVAALVAGAYLVTPRTQGLSGEWSAPAPATKGEVVAGRALVTGSNAALDLRTGRSIRLGSVVGGRASYADDRLVVTNGGQVDSAALDGSTRWTWRAAGGHTAIPLAAANGSTLLADCPATTADPCRLVGLDPSGKQGWETPGATRPSDPPQSSLPRVLARAVQGGGVLLTDPTSGRTSLQPGASFVAVPDGPVVVTVVQGGQCVVSLYTALDPLWTRVLGACPLDRVPQTAVTGDAVVLTSPGKTERLALASGSTLRQTAGPTVEDATETAGDVVASTRVEPVRSNPLRWGQDDHLVELHDARSGELLARLVTDEPVRVLLLDSQAVVVRQGDRIVRYTLDD